MKKTLTLVGVFALFALTGTAQKNYDLNGDGAENVGDVTTLVNIILGKTQPAMPGEGFSPAGKTADGHLQDAVKDAAGNVLASLSGVVEPNSDGGVYRILSYYWNSPNQFVEGEGNSQKVFTYTLNADGFISETTEVETEGGMVQVETTSNYTYDADNRLVGMAEVIDMTGLYGFEFKVNTTKAFTYDSKGDLVKCVTTSKGTMDGSPSVRTTTVSYSDEPNPLLRPLVLIAGSNNISVSSSLMVLGFFGVGPAHLPKSIKFDADTWSYNVTLRSDGTVSKEDVGGWMTYENYYTHEPQSLSDLYDLNGDGDVNVGDVTTLVNRILGKI